MLPPVLLMRNCSVGLSVMGLEVIAALEVVLSLVQVGTVIEIVIEEVIIGDGCVQVSVPGLSWNLDGELSLLD